MQPSEANDIVAAAARLVADRYVFPEVGARLAELLDDRRVAGHYAVVDGPTNLAARVTADLQSVNQDRHLRLQYHEEEIPDLPDDGMLMELLTREAARTMSGVARVDRLDRNVAHLDLSPILFPPPIAGDSLVAAMQLVAAADALILDLRRTVGGDPTTVALVCSYLFDEPVHLTDIYERPADRTTQYWTLPYVPGRRFGGTKPVYVLTSATTFSGGEAVAYELQQIGRATVVGERTRGGAHPRTGHRVHPHLELTVPTGRSIHPVSGTDWEGVGVEPDHAVPADRALDVAYERICAQLS